MLISVNQIIINIIILKNILYGFFVYFFWLLFFINDHLIPNKRKNALYFHLGKQKSNKYTCIKKNLFQKQYLLKHLKLELTWGQEVKQKKKQQQYFPTHPFTIVSDQTNGPLAWLLAHGKNEKKNRSSTSRTSDAEGSVWRGWRKTTSLVVELVTKVICNKI